MTKWQRRLRAAIAVFGLAFAALVYFAIREGRSPAAPATAVDRVDPAAVAESTGGVHTQIKGTEQRFRVEYDRSLAYPDGRQRLVGARVFVNDRGGRSFTLKGAEADVGANEDHVEFHGGVELTSSDGLTATAPEATYAQSEGVVRATGETTFQEKRLTGSSVGLTYDRNRDVVWLPARAVLLLADEAPDRAPVRVTAGKAGLARRDHYARFEDAFTLEHDARTLQSDQATAYLTEDGSAVQTLEMRGHARASGLGAGVGSLRAMEADDLNLEFAGDGRTMRAATLSRNAVIEVQGEGAAPRRISGTWIDLRLADDGATVTSVVVREGVLLELPAEGGERARSIQAQTMAATAEAGKGLDRVIFTDDVTLREAAGAGSGAARVATARSMTLSVAPGLGRLDEATFDGAFRFQEDKVRAAAARGTYGVSTGVVTLEGIDEATGQAPRVSDGEATIDGTTVTLTLEGRKILAMQDVRCVMAPVTADAKPAGGDAPTRPAMLAGDQPVYATAGQLAYDGAARLATYTGGARLWQGDTAIQGDQITLDGSTGNLQAKGTVRSTLMLKQGTGADDAAGAVPTVTTSGSLAYEEKGRKAVYAQDAHVSGPTGDLRASRIELYLAESGKDLDRVEAFLGVVMQHEDRTATGARMTYYAADGRYVMSGSPVRIVAECRDTSGRTLTFYRSTDTIIVDGNDETRTLTKGGAKCEARRSP